MLVHREQYTYQKFKIKLIKNVNYGNHVHNGRNGAVELIRILRASNRHAATPN